jgi:AcrR family transcriptional regulator
MATAAHRRYDSRKRNHAAQAARNRVLEAARTLFSRHGIDKVTVGRIAQKAGVSTATVYARYKSKDGLLQAIVGSSLFGARFQAAQVLMEDVDDGAQLVTLTAKVARAIYESESRDLGLMRGASAFSPTLQKIERHFEQLRYEMQVARLRLLFKQGKQKHGLDFETARQIMWMYTSRDVYRMLVHEAEWTPDTYETWLEETLCQALVATTK